MDILLRLGTGFFECLFLVLAAGAFFHGRRMYGLAAVGLAFALFARMSDGFLNPGVDVLLKVVGYGVAVLVLLVDVVFEEVEAPDDQTGRAWPEA